MIANRVETVFVESRDVRRFETFFEFNIENFKTQTHCRLDFLTIPRQTHNVSPVGDFQRRPFRPKLPLDC